MKRFQGFQEWIKERGKRMIEMQEEKSRRMLESKDQRLDTNESILLI